MNTASGRLEALSRRRERKRRALSVTAIGVIAALVLAVVTTHAVRSAGRTASAVTGKPRIVTTTNFLDDTVRQVGGEHIETVRLMPPGVDPHLYQAKASDLREMRRADAVFAVGLYLEGSLQRTLEEIARSRPVLFAGATIPPERLLSPPADAAPEEEYDPHVWLDPALWAFVVQAITDQLVELDPDNAADYRHRGAEYRAQVLALSTEIRSAIERIPPRQRQLVTSHDAFRYFGRAFGLDVVAIQGISTQSEATTTDVGRVADRIAESEVPSVFVETSVPRQMLDSVLAAVRQRGGDVRIGGELYSDSAGDDGTPEGTYLGMIRANTAQLVAGLT